MRLIIARALPPRPQRIRFARVWPKLVMLLALAVLTLQLCALGWHNHPIFEKDDDCASCQMAAEDLPPPLMLLQPDMPASLSFFIRNLTSQPRYFFIALASPYLGPYSQAPPDRS